MGSKIPWRHERSSPSTKKWAARHQPHTKNKIGKKTPKPAEPAAPSNCLPRGRGPESKEHAVLQVGPGPPALSPPKTGPVGGAQGGTDRKRGGGERSFQISGKKAAPPSNE